MSIKEVLGARVRPVPLAGAIARQEVPPGVRSVAGMPDRPTMSAESPSGVTC
ncbi:hypothetical protein HNP84_005279 [Thermocatellispora tengchongensis]|uniref:Uncharacterized protein n=1 Tax=Thermocatellispora tengchongensis TaxID=1073253 RepID=A0A840PHL1_9ACTN|nr:hypothetical protein [Thermocatellispora tengchongensis]MBB5135535.1 hypothetical protein [Thermocatellispora tengchongensis]